MDSVPDYELQKSPEEIRTPTPRRPRGGILWVVAGVLILALGLTQYFLRRSATDAAPSTLETESTVSPAPGTDRPLGAEPLAVLLPPLDVSDDVVRKLVGALSSHPRVAAWLATQDLIRTFTVVVTNIADGEAPARHVPSLRPTGRFQVVERDDEISVHPMSYERYAPLAAAAAAIDPDGAARLYATLKPLIEEAHRDLGGDTSFDTTLQRAIAQLLATPILNEPVTLVPRGIVWGFEDPKLEALSPPKKQFLRFGARHVETIQQSLRRIGAALGMSPAALPAAYRSGRMR